MKCEYLLGGYKRQISAYLLLLAALLSGDWSPVLLLIIAALVAEWRQREVQG